MAEIRQNPVSGAWTDIAPERGARPFDSASKGEAGAASTCPFCSGNEALTPPEIDALRPPEAPAPDTPGWRVRVVPNKYPAFAGPGGAHEVIIHSPHHDRDLDRLSVAEVADVLTMYQRRIAANCAAGAAAVTVIINHGSAAGASLTHPHSQLFATPIVPPLLDAERERCARYADEHGGCLLCDLMAAERRTGERLVFDDGEFTAFTPAASRFAYELWLAPRIHEEEVGRAAAPRRAAARQRALRAVTIATAGAAFNVWLHTAPCGASGPFHWHFEIAPRTAALAGFELATAMTLNVVEPTQAATRLRKALLSE